MKNRKIRIFTLAVTVVLLVASLLAITLFANTETATADDFKMVDGASVRISDPTGIRFTASLSPAKYAEIIDGEAYKDGYKLGMLIAPKAYFEAYEDQTEYTDYYKYLTEVKECINLSFNAVQPKMNDENTAYVFHGAIVNIKEANFALEFQAVAYIAKTEGETITRTYTALSEARSINTVATSAVKSGKETVETEDKLISAYQLDIGALRTLNVTFDTAVPYSKDMTKVTAKTDSGETLVIRDGMKIRAKDTDKVTVSHPDYMPVNVTVGADTTKAVSFVRAKFATSDGATYNESTLKATVPDGKSGRLMETNGKDFAVQLTVKLSDVVTGNVAGIVINRLSGDNKEAFSYGFRHQDNCWGFVSPCEQAWGGDFVANGWFQSGKTNYANYAKACTELNKGTVSEIVMTFVYHNNTRIVDAYYNGELVTNYYVTDLSGVSTHVAMYATAGGTSTFSDWNYGLKGSDAYNAICHTVGVHTWNEGEVTTPATETADGVKTYTCTVDGCTETRTETVHYNPATYTFTYSFDTTIPYSKDTSLVTVTKDGIEITLTDNKVEGGAGDTFVFSHSDYMPVTVTLGTETNVNVSFCRARIAQTNGYTYDESNHTATVAVDAKPKLLNPDGKDFAVQLKFDPRNMKKGESYGLSFNAGWGYCAYGFTLGADSWATATASTVGFTKVWNDDSAHDGLGLFSNCSLSNVDEILTKLKNNEYEEFVLTFVYSFDGKGAVNGNKGTLKCYLNGELAVTYNNAYTNWGGYLAVVSLLTPKTIQPNGFTGLVNNNPETYLDWNYGLVGTDAYNAIIAQLTEKKS